MLLKTNVINGKFAKHIKLFENGNKFVYQNMVYNHNYNHTLQLIREKFSKKVDPNI